MGEKWKPWLIFISWASKSLQTAGHKIKRYLLLGRAAMTNLDSILKSRDITLPTKGLSSESYIFSNRHVRMWQLDSKESWVLKNWCFWTVVLEKTLQSPLDGKEIQPVNPKGISPENLLERLMLKLKLEYFGLLMGRTNLLEKAWCWERLKARGKGDNRGWDGEWHHQHNGHEFEWAVRVGDV